MRVGWQKKKRVGKELILVTSLGSRHKLFLLDTFLSLWSKSAYQQQEDR